MIRPANGGDEDKIILEKHFKFITKNKEVDSEVIILHAGHNELIKKTAKFLKESKETQLRHAYVLP